MRSMAFAAGVAAVIASLGLLLRASPPEVPTNTWAATGAMSVGRAGASAALLYDGRILVTGGTTDGGVSASAELYSYSPPASGFVATTDNMQTARANHTSSLLPNGHVLVAGGIGADGQALSAAEIYDPSTNLWTTTIAPMNHARAGHTASALFDGRIVIAGGDDAGSLELFDPDTGDFTLLAPTLPESVPVLAYPGHAAALLYDGRLVIAGGFNGSSPVNSVYLYDP